jgi:hypothetical protein
LAQNLAKLVEDRGYLPFVIIRPENEASQNLYKKLGFEKAFTAARIILVPFTNHEVVEEYDEEALNADIVEEALNVDQLKDVLDGVLSEEVVDEVIEEMVENGTHHHSFELESNCNGIQHVAS